MKRLKKGDPDIIISGKSKGHSGDVLRVLPKEDRVVVRGGNLCVVHEKPSKKHPEGGRMLREMSIHVSNVAFYDEESGNSSRIGFAFDESGKKYRYLKKTGKRIGA